jgi:hypothetical protein
MTLPNFLIIGSQKCGTTSLHDIVAKHPEANMSSKKEINFFTNEKLFEKGEEYYSSFFKTPKPHQIITGESTPSYICHPNTAEKIYQTLGKDIKLVLLLRDPIKRAYSQYWDSRTRLRQRYTKDKIIDMYLSDEYSPNIRGYFSRGVYIKYINQYLKYFDDSQLHIIIFEELINNQNIELRRLYNFLEINPEEGLQKLPKPSNVTGVYKNKFYKFFFNNPSFQRYLPKGARPLLYFGKKIKFKYRMPEGKDLDILKNFYKPYNQQLEEYLGKPLTHWT